MPELSIILVNYNDRAHVLDCLAGLMDEAERIDLEILVVDNDSSDGSPELIEERFPAVRLIRSGENLGFSRANNRGSEESRGEYLLFLNTDTRTPPGAIEGLLEWMRAHPYCGGTGPRLYDEEGRFQVSFGGPRGFLREMAAKIFLNALLRRKIRRMEAPRDASWISAACLMVRRDAFLGVNGFDEEFFLYFEDIDLCMRIGQEGWRLTVVPESRIFHAGGASTSALSLKSRYFYRQSQLRYYHKHNSRTSRALLRIFLRLDFVRLALAGWLSRKADMDIRREFFGLLKED